MFLFHYRCACVFYKGSYLHFLLLLPLCLRPLQVRLFLTLFL